MAGIGMILSIIGTGLSVVSSIQQGKAQQAALNMEARSREMKAKEDVAAGQREMLEKRHKTAEALSRGQAVMAASGAGKGASFVEIMDDVAERGEYLATTELYNGKSKAAGELDQAAAARMRGKAAAQGGLLSGIASGFSGLSGAFKSYG